MAEEPNFSMHNDSQFVLSDVDGIHANSFNSNKAARNWIKSISSIFGLGVLSPSSQIPTPQGFSPFLDLQRSPRPDVLVCHNHIPLFAVEILSESNISKTFNKAVYDAIEFLRIWRSYDPSFLKAHSLMLPSLTTRCNAILVAVSFEPFRFNISYKFLEKSILKSTIESILTSLPLIGRKCASTDAVSSLVRLNANDLHLFEQGHQKACQYFSTSSILVECGPSVYKYIQKPSPCFCIQLARSPSLTKCLFPPPDPVWFSNLPFYKFTKLQPPLSRAEAKPCLVPLLKGIRNALEELNSVGLSHLDLRLPNICFDKGIPILIDLDRCEYAKESSQLHIYLKSDMYAKPSKCNDWTHQNVDLRSLGMIILYVLDDSIQAEDYHQMISGGKVRRDLLQDCFIFDLLNGLWSSSNFSMFTAKFKW